MRLFQLQVIDHPKYDNLLLRQHTRVTSTKAERWDIYAMDKSWQPVKLTENMTLYDIAIDPTMIGETESWNSMKPRVIQLLTPVVYKHFCELYGMTKVTPEQCIQHIESFSNQQLLPKLPQLFYYWSGFRSPEYDTFDFAAYDALKAEVISWFTRQKAESLISQRLEEKIQIWIKPKNYMGMYTSQELLSDLLEQKFSFIDISYDYYIYVVPSKSLNASRDKRLLQNFFKQYGYVFTNAELDRLFTQQVYKYVKLFTSANPQIAKEIQDLKIQYYSEKSKTKIPVLHWIILESYVTRYYPRESFMANILWYVDRAWDAYFGVEKYFDEILKWIDGEVKWRSSSFVGTVWVNDFEIINAKDWDDVFLTIDVWIQKEIESIAQKYLKDFNADSISIMVYNPLSWQVKAMAQAPTFNPNNYNDAYELIPLGVEYSQIVDDLTYIDMPVYILSGNSYKIATVSQRQDVGLAKYIPKNVFWSQVFMDRNISVPFEPGSVFKAITMAIGMDTDEIRWTDFYDDPWEVKVWTFTIKNASSICKWYHTFLEWLINSCNVGMIRVVQRVGKEIFYNYLENFGFWKITWIELAEEKPWTLDNPVTVAMSRFLNNSFWQGIQVTQIQLAMAYSSLINWWKIIKPTILSYIWQKKSDTDVVEKIMHVPEVLSQIIRYSVSENLRWSLLQVMNNNPDYESASVPGYRLGAKSGTAQMSYRWTPQRWNGRTQATFVWVVTVDNPEYLVLIWISRPRTSQWWVATSGRVFREVARFLLGYSFI